MGRRRRSNQDPVIDDFEKLRSLRWSDPISIERELDYLLDDPSVARAGRYSKDRLKRVEALGRLLDRMLSRIAKREESVPPASGRSLAFAGSVLLRRTRALHEGESLASATVGELQQTIEERWKVTQGPRKGEPLRPGVFKQHHQALVYAELAEEFHHFIESLLARPARPSKERGSAGETNSEPARINQVAKASSPNDPASTIRPAWSGSLSEFIAERLGRKPSRSVLAQIAQSLGHHNADALDRTVPTFFIESWDPCFAEFSPLFERITQRRPFTHVALINDDIDIWLVYLIRRGHDGLAISLAKTEIARLVQERGL